MSRRNPPARRTPREESPPRRLRIGLLRTGFLIGAFLILWTATNWGSFTDLAIAQVERDQELAEKVRLQTEIDRMKTQRDALQTDRSALERVAREDHRLAYPGEVVVMLEREPSEN
jgi:cell division protein FtsB